MLSANTWCAIGIPSEVHNSPITIRGRSPRWSREYPNACDQNRSDGRGDPSKQVKVKSPHTSLRSRFDRSRSRQRGHDPLQMPGRAQSGHLPQTQQRTCGPPWHRNTPTRPKTSTRTPRRPCDDGSSSRTQYRNSPQLTRRKLCVAPTNLRRNDDRRHKTPRQRPSAVTKLPPTRQTRAQRCLPIGR